MPDKLINVGTEDYSLSIPADVRVAVYGLETPALNDMGKLLLLKSRIVFHDGSGRHYDSPLPAHQVIKLIEDSGNDFRD